MRARPSGAHRGAGARALALEAVLFDLDGTLIDSIELIRRSWRHALQAHGHPFDEERWLAGLGTPLQAQLHALGEEAELERIVATYRAYNARHHDELVRAYEGVEGALGALAARGLRLAVVTSKGHERARHGLARCGLGRFFPELVGADDCATHKPDPAPLLLALERLGVAAERAAYVGDSPHDLVAARAAGMLAIGVLWGPFPRERLVAAGAERILERPSELASLA